MKYRISDKAIEDINSIWLYTLENWSLEQADKYYSFIYQEITSIPNNFEKGKDIGNIKFGYRQTPDLSASTNLKIIDIDFQ